jgi:hypothetical protein
MFRAVYRQIVRFLDSINRSRPGSSASQITREAADYRRDLEIRSGSRPGWLVGLKGGCPQSPSPWDQCGGARLMVSDIGGSAQLAG